jgi:hypothetical protein
MEIFRLKIMLYLFNRLFNMRYDKIRNLRQYLWSSQGITARRRNTFQMEQIENRYTLSADVAPLALIAELLEAQDLASINSLLMENTL